MGAGVAVGAGEGESVGAGEGVSVGAGKEEGSEVMEDTVTAASWTGAGVKEGAVACGGIRVHANSPASNDRDRKNNFFRVRKL